MPNNSISKITATAAVKLLAIDSLACIVGRDDTAYRWLGTRR